MHTFLNVVLSVGVLQGFSFVGYGLLGQKNRQPALNYLLAFVFFLSLNNIQIVLFVNDFFKGHALLQSIEFSWYLLIIPYFNAFVIHYFEIDQKEKPYIKAAWLLFVSQLLVRAVFIGLEQAHQIDHSYLFVYTKVEEVINLVVSLGLFYKIAVYVLRAEYSEKIAEFDNLHWLRYFVIAGFIVIFFWITAVVLNLFETGNNKYMYNPPRISTTVMLYWIAYVGMLKMNVTANRKQFVQVREQKIAATENETAHSSADFDKIEQHITQNKRFTDPHFTLDRLAIEMQMSRGYVSKLINQEAGTFSEYINIKRVEAAKTLLLKESSSRFTLEVLAYECGFKSKSNFFLLFKKYTDCSPSEWRNQQTPQ
jgi:AraC-like DNA-binding protein